jgi:hypothetical protein
MKRRPAGDGASFFGIGRMSKSRANVPDLRFHRERHRVQTHAPRSRKSLPKSKNNRASENSEKDYFFEKSIADSQKHCRIKARRGRAKFRDFPAWTAMFLSEIGKRLRLRAADYSAHPWLHLEVEYGASRFQWRARRDAENNSRLLRLQQGWRGCWR